MFDDDKIVVTNLQAFYIGSSDDPEREIEMTARTSD